VYTAPTVNNLTKNRKSKIWLLLWLTLFALALVWRAQNLDAFGLSNDEGVYLMWSQLTADGYALYSETYAVQPPLFFEAVALAFRLAGSTIAVGRWAILAGFLLLALVLSWLAHRAGGWLLALVTMFLLGISPLIFTLSRLVMAEVPAMALAVTSLALVLVYLDRRYWGWLFASGLLLGLSLITKTLNPFMAAPVGFLLLACHFGTAQNIATTRKWRNFVRDGLLWGLGVILPLAVLPLLYDPAAMVDQLLVFRSELRAAVPGSWSDTGLKFAVFIQDHWGICLLAGAGIVTAVWREVITRTTQYGRRSSLLPLTPPALYPLTWTIWLLGGILMLLWHTPLFPHHFVVLLPPLIVLAAGFMADIVVLSHSWKGAYVLWLVVVVAAFNLPAMVQANQKIAAIVTGGREIEALKLLEAVSAPADFVMGDSQLLIFMAGRRTPPQLGDVALVAIKAGRQTSERMIGITKDVDAPAVVQWSLRLPWLPEYLAWVEENYLAKQVWDNDHIIYFVPRFSPERAVPNAREQHLGELLRLRGYEIGLPTDVGAPTTVNVPTTKAGDTLGLKVYWQTDAPLTDDYTVFTQLLDSKGVLVQGWDSQPLGGYFPTSQWPANEIVTDFIQFPLPADLPPGNYTLITGMYLLDIGERLIQPDGTDYIKLSTISVP